MAQNQARRKPKSNGKLHLDQDNFDEYIRQFSENDKERTGVGWTIGKNARSKQRVIRFSDGSYEDHDADAAEELQARLERKCRKADIRSDLFKRRLRIHANRRKFDPIAEWFDGVEVKDGGPTLSGWLFDLYPNTEDTPLNRFIAESVFLAPALLFRNPGTRLRFVPTFIGPAGCGKSTLVECLSPPSLRDLLHSDCFDLSMSNDNRARALRGRSFVEISELSGMRKAAWESIKQLTATNYAEVVSIKYVEGGEKYPRTWMFYGTANPGVVLPGDKVAAERFLPCHIVDNRASMDPEKYMALYRDHLFSLALHRIDVEGIAKLPIPADLLKAHSATVADHRHDSDFMRCAKFLTEKFAGSEFVTSKDLLIHARQWFESSMSSVPANLMNRLAGSLKSADCGWISNKTKRLQNAAKPVRGWVPPKRLPEDWAYDDADVVSAEADTAAKLKVAHEKLKKARKKIEELEAELRELRNPTPKKMAVAERIANNVSSYDPSLDFDSYAAALKENIKAEKVVS